MKLASGFARRAAAELNKVRSAGKDELRRFRMAEPTMRFPVSEGMSDAPTSTDLAPPGRLAASKGEKGVGALRLSNPLLFPTMPPIYAKPQIKERPSFHTDGKEQKTPDATIPLDEKSVGTITFDTSKGSTMVQ